jgi:hypothetical protein
MSSCDQDQAGSEWSFPPGESWAFAPKLESAVLLVTELLDSQVAERSFAYLL